MRKPHTSTADLLTWSENPQADSPAVGSAASRSATRSHQVAILMFCSFFWLPKILFADLEIGWFGFVGENFSRRMGSVRWYSEVR